MTLYDAFALFGLFILFAGVALLLYVQVLGLLARIHFRYFNKVESLIQEATTQQENAN